MSQRPQISIVLVQPKNSGNIGAVARVMMNFGFNDLRLVLPQCDPLNKESRDRARLAFGLIEKASLHMKTSDAVADCQVVWGTSGILRGHSPDELTPTLAKEKLATLPSDTKLALVFGPEERGLDNNELRPCDAIIVIPTRDEFASMNLSHAVAIMLHELSVKIPGETDITPREMATSQAREGLYNHLQETLLGIGFLDKNNPERIMRDLRNILGRSHLDQREITILRGICRQIATNHKRNETN